MSNYDVALIGLGPVGCAAAILFAEAGLKVVAFERDTEVYRLPRAVNLDGEIIRAFQSSGRGKAVEALMQPVRPGFAVCEFYASVDVWVRQAVSAAMVGSPCPCLISPNLKLSPATGSHSSPGYGLCRRRCSQRAKR